MAIFKIIGRKIWKNKWIVSSLLIGMIVTIALFAAMPLYADAIMNRMLVSDLERIQSEQQQAPGSIRISMDLRGEAKTQRRNTVYATQKLLDELTEEGIQLPLLQKEQVLFSEKFALQEKKQKMRIATESDLFAHIQLVDGKWPAQQVVDGNVEVLVSLRELNRLDAVVGNVLPIDAQNMRSPLKIKIAGVYEQKGADDAYFYQSELGTFTDSLLVDRTVFEDVVLKRNQLALGAVEFYTAIDFQQMTMQKIPAFLAANEQLTQWVDSNDLMFSNAISIPSVKLISEYETRADQLHVLILSITIPVLFLLLFYMYMISNILIDRQKTEIAVLRSRGYTRKRVLWLYLIEALLLGGIALLVALFTARVLVQMMGASNGFLNFVGRAVLRVEWHAGAFLYAVAALACCLVMYLIPAYMAARVSIVERRQDAHNQGKRSFWQRYFLDVILLIIAVYGLYAFHARLDTVVKLGLKSGEVAIDPLQFVLPAVFIIGAGMFLLRVYPQFVRLIYWIGKKWWGPAAYASLLQVSRTTLQYQFIMIFLILTISLGMFSASTARTMNSNVEDQIRYRNGADVVLQPLWPKDENRSVGPGSGNGNANSGMALQTKYYEPPLDPFVQAEQVKHYARVFIKEKVRVSGNQANDPVTLLGIDTYDFGMTTWFREGLLSHDLNAYLNVMASDPQAVLISRSMADKLKKKVGDPLTVGWDGATAGSFIVYAIVDYFPSFIPVSTDEQLKNKQPMLVVGHLSKIQSEIALEPYQVWIKFKAGVSKQAYFNTLAERDVQVLSIKDTYAQLYQAKRDPFLMAVNGVLTLSFLVSLGICALGFLLFWLLSVERRALQFGIFRALGISFRSLVGMLGLEQLLTSGAAIVLGLGVGYSVSYFYVPLFQSAFDAQRLVPPFQVVFQTQDVLNIFVLIGGMLVLALSMLAWMISRMKMNQVLKLGED